MIFFPKLFLPSIYLSPYCFFLFFPFGFSISLFISSFVLLVSSSPFFFLSLSTFSLYLSLSFFLSFFFLSFLVYFLSSYLYFYFYFYFYLFFFARFFYHLLPLRFFLPSHSPLPSHPLPSLLFLVLQITNTAKLKRMSKKQLKRIEKR